MHQMCLPIHSVQDWLKCRVFTLDIFSAKLLNEWEGDEDTQLLGAYQLPFPTPKSSITHSRISWRAALRISGNSNSFMGTDYSRFFPTSDVIQPAERGAGRGGGKKAMRW